MNTIILAIIGLLLWSFLLGFIIKEATQSKLKIKYQDKQLALLARIAHRLGVDLDEVNKILAQ